MQFLIGLFIFLVFLSKVDGGMVGPCADAARTGYIPGAEACTDIANATTCEKIATGVSTRAAGAANAPECATADKALLEACRYSCALCCEMPEHNCEDDKDMNCATMKDKCNLPEYRELLVAACPATCGFCMVRPVPKPGECADLLPNCKKDYKMMCTDVRFREDMKTKCAKTCDLCKEIANTTSILPITTPASVVPGQTQPGQQSGPTPQTGAQIPFGTVDTYPNCYANREKCGQEVYQALMRQNCGPTCRDYLSSKTTLPIVIPAPNPAPAPISPPMPVYDDYYEDNYDYGEDGDCFDASPNCETWILNNGYCDNDKYAERDCAYTCEYC